MLRYRRFWHSWLSVSVVLASLTIPLNASARPANVFLSQLDRIQQNIPSGLIMRLPSDIKLIGASDIDESQLNVYLTPSKSPLRYTVSLFTCERSIYPCLLGSFSVEDATSANARLELQRHQKTGDRVTLSPYAQGYLIEGLTQSPYSPFSTLVWQQGDMIYSISYPANERPSLISMGISMANNRPMY